MLPVTVKMGLEILQGADLFLVTSTCILEGCIEVLHQVTLPGCFGLSSQVGYCCKIKHLGSIIYIQKLPLLLGHVFPWSHVFTNVHCQWKGCLLEVRGDLWILSTGVIF